MNRKASQATAANASDRSVEAVMPLLAEDVAVTKRLVETGRVAVKRVTRERCASIDEPLMSERVELTRTPVGRLVDHVPDIRREGETIVIPIVEERLVVVRQLFLKEEVRVKRARSTARHRDTLRLRHHEIVIDRTCPAEEKSRSDPTQERHP